MTRTGGPFYAQPFQKYVIRSLENPAFVLDCSLGRPKVNDVILYQFNGNANQRWTF